ncbi:L,D-transpeptidase [Azospira sp. I13]|uniref:L,D-transpeptidase n=1 Tax=Azospira sp. I13 TaxID=1765050 RepID=UPI000D449C47|nr:L,D-transpeptidase [Azospira sp. I13]GBG03524.1 L,D-transpeptidase [Azospira sp. I13]
MKLRVSLARQVLELRDDEGALLRTYPVSTAARGPGEVSGSFQTPRGRHYVRAKIGEDMPPRAVFRGRRFTGEICTPELQAAEPQRDWILSRILWLCGREPGVNRLGEVDTMARYIYIHGTADEAALGTPVSHGCIRMGNDDIVELFERVPAYTEVEIAED